MTQPMLAPFGAGRLYGTRQDVANSAPTEFGVLQDVSWDFTFQTKSLMGSNQFAVFVARAEAKWTAKAKSAVMSGDLLNSIFFGQAMTGGSTQLQTSESHAIPATPFTVTVTPPGSGTFLADEGVVNSATGVPFTQVASGPTAGQYSVNLSTGAYLFSSADNVSGITALISYTYTLGSTAQKITLTNQLLGTTPYFSMVYRNRDPRSGLFTTWTFNRATSTKLSMASKTSDYMIEEFDIEIMDDGTGAIGTMSMGDLT